MDPFRRVYITGFMGCGKSTAGKNLATAMKFSFIDLDHEIEKREGRKIAEIFSKSGEEYFRKAETKALRNLKISSDTVISTGGGTPCFADNLSFMKNSGIIIYLKMSPQQLKDRLAGEDSERPLLKDLEDAEILNFISEKLKEREQFYSQATIVVDGVNPDIKSISQNIFSFLR